MEEPTVKAVGLTINRIVRAQARVNPDAMR
jgi:hypothetical protein